MIRLRFLTPRKTKTVTRRSNWGLVLVVALLAAGCIALGTFGRYNVKGESGPAVRAGARAKAMVHAQDGRQLKPEYKGDWHAAEALQTGSARPLSMATADFDLDGAPDLVTGYAHGGRGVLAVQRGNVDAFVPRDLTIYDRAAQGQLPPSFLPTADAIQLPEPADFVLTEDINEDGRKDLVVAARNGGLYVLVNDGDGAFGAPEQLALPGTVTALTAGAFGHAQGWRAVIVATDGPQGPALALFNLDTNGLSHTATISALPAPATSLVLGSFDDDPYFDLAVAAGRQILIVHGQKPAAPVSDGTPIDLGSRIEQIDLGFDLRGLAAGTFVADRVPRMDLAALAGDGTIHLFQRRKLNTLQPADPAVQFADLSPYQIRAGIRKRFLEQVKASVRVPMWQPGGKQPWNELRQLEMRVPAPGVNASSSLFGAAKVSGRRIDDLMVVDGADLQVRVFVDDSLGQLAPGEKAADTARSRVPVTFGVDSAPVAALVMPQKINGERDLMILSAGHTTAGVVPLANVTLTVNNITDQIRNSGNLNLNCNGVANDCSLREAVLKANINANTTGHTINVPGNLGTYNLSVNNPGTLASGTIALPDLEIGSSTGNNVTVMGTSGTPHIHQTIANNDVITTGFNTTTGAVAIVTLSLQNLEITGGTFTGIFTGADDGAGNISNTTITNCNVHNNSNADATFGQGGAHQNQCGTLSIQTSTYASNSATNSVRGQGGAVFYDIVNAMGQCSVGDFTVTNSTFTSNIASVQAGFPAGGGVIAIVSSSGTAVPISGTTFSMNQANGGGDGGALAWSTSTRTMNVTTSTFTSNQVSNASGRGGAVDCNAGTLNVNFNRFIGNTATTTQNGKALFRNGGTFNGNDNWWGLNTGPDTSCGVSNPCDVAGTVTLTRWLQLRNVISGVNVHNTNQIAPGTTADFRADIFGLNTGGSTAAANLIGLLTFPNPAAAVYSNGSPSLGSINVTTSQYVSGQAAATTTFTSNGTKGTATVNSLADSETFGAQVVIGFTPVWVNPAGSDVVATAFTSGAACGGVSNVPCFATIGAALTNVAIGGTIHITAGTYNESPNFDTPNCQSCITTIDGNVQLNGSITMSTGTINANSFNFSLTGDFTKNSGVFNPGTGTVTFNGSGTQTIGGTTVTQTFNNFVVNKSGGTLATGGSTTGMVVNDLTMTAGTFNAPASLDINGNTLLSGGTLNAGTSITAAGNWTNNGGTFTPGSGTVTFDGSGAQTINGTAASQTFNNFTVNKSGGALSTGGSTTQLDLSGNFSLSAGSFTAPANLNIAGDFLQSSGTTFTPGAGTVTFNSTGARALNGLVTQTFNNLVFSKTSGGSVTVGGSTATLTVNGNLTITAGTFVAGTATTINAKGNWSNAGTFTPGSGTVFFNGMAAQAIGGTSNTTFSGLTINNGMGVTLNNDASGVDASVSGALTLTTDLTLAANAILQQSGSSSGAADVIGTVRRTDLGVSARAFGNPFNTIAIDSATMTPTQIDVTLVKAFPVDFTTAVARTYTIAETGGVSFSATLKLHYLTGELNGNTENKLALWRKNGSWGAQGRTGSVDTVNKAVSLSGVGMFSDWTLAAVDPPTINKAFAASTIPLNVASPVTFTITNPNTLTALNGLAFSDTLTGGLVVADTPNVNNNCGGSVTAVALSTSISLSGGTVSSGGNCTISVDIKGTTAGAKSNITGAISSTNGGTGTTSNTANVTVVAPPTIAKAFGATSIPLNGTTSLTLTITNGNSATALTGISFGDTLPAGLVVADTPSASNTCGGTFNPMAADTSLTFSGGTLAAASMCTVSVNVKGTTAGTKSNTTGTISATEGGTGATSNPAMIDVVAPPTISKAFNPTPIAVNGTSTLTFTITNPAANAVSQTGVAFTDNLPSGLEVAATPNVVNNCGGTFNPLAGATMLTFSGGTVSINTFCTISVDVTATSSGTKDNTTNAISSTNGGTGATSNAATLTVCLSGLVTTAADSGAGSLRQVIADACDGGTITFDIAGGGPDTITLTTGQIVIDKSLTITGPTAKSTIITSSGSRLFTVNSGKTVTMSNLNLTGGNGSAGNGGAILNQGTLNLLNMSVNANTATGQNGGGLFNDTTGTLRVINSTVSGNSATLGGGIYNDGTLVLTNATISANTAANFGGGLYNNTAHTAAINNTIIAGNTGTMGDPDVSANGADLTGDYNLVGDTTGISGGLPGSNNITNTSANLGALAFNGGPTQTHALLATSPAIEAGNNALAVDQNAAALTTDQRGTGFPRIADSADANTTQTVDMGAFELHPTIEDIGNQTTNEDTAKMVTFNLGDDTGALISMVTATSSNTALVMSDGAHLSFTGSGGTRTLTITPNPNANSANSGGNTTITITVTATNGRTASDMFDLTVNAVNDAPVVTTTGGNLSYTENDPATAIDPGLTVTDIDSTDLVGATVAITGNFASGQDVLAFTNQLGITGSYNSGTGVLTLTGTTTVANYQTALRSVTYQNSSDNPSTATRTVTFTANDGTDTGSATRGIAITAVNDAPVNTVPGPQGTAQNTPLVFSSGNGNQISVADVDAGSGSIKVTLSVTNGTLTLSGTTGLDFNSGTCSGAAGDGTADATMTFCGSLTNVNNALNGMSFNPTMGFSGAASLTITSNDLGNTGSGGPLSDTDVVNIQVATSISIQDAQVVEPISGSVNMIFTVTLSAPAPASGVTVNFTTQDQAPAMNHAVAGADYTTTSGTVSFAAGEQFRTILVPVLADGDNAEQNETFLVNLSSPVNGVISDGSATGTILITNQPGTILISELRTSGPAGAGDDFVEIYNNSDTPHTVAASDSSGGYGLFKMGADCSATPLLIGVIPNGTIIPARGHYLLVGSAYSLANYGGTGAAAGDQMLSSDIESDRNVAIFSTASVTGISSANRFDAVGFGSNTGGNCDLLREGTTLYPTSGSVTEHSYFRKMCDFISGVGCSTPGSPKDTNDNTADFLLADTIGSLFGTTQRLGAPGPENLGAPVRRDPSLSVLLLDSSVASSISPNRVRDFAPVTNGANGTLSIRRRVFNGTGAPVTRLRFRAVEVTTFNVPVGTADLRALTSSDVAGVVINNDSGTCGGPSTCTVTVRGTTLETPPAQPVGGGWNSTLSSGTITLGTPLANGASINVQFLLGVQQTGTFRYLIIVEALP